MKKLKRLEKLIIDRKWWLRGEGSGYSYLLRRDDNKMCCLGFYARQKGYSAKGIKGIISPDELKGGFKRMPALVESEIGDCTDVCGSLMTANDSPFMSDKKREYRLTTLFKKIGIAVHFKGRY